MPNALITGATGHLGKATATLFAANGYNLILIDLDGRNVKALSDEIEAKHNVKVLVYECDFKSFSDREIVLSKILQDVETLDVLINNAAYTGSTNLEGWLTSFEDLSLSVWAAALEVNLNAPVHFCQKLLPLLKNSQNASIINISSIYASRAPDWRLYEHTNMGNPVAYGVSKAGLEQFTRWLASVLGPKIRVNAVAPGGILRDQPPAFIERYNAKTPLARMASELEIAEAIYFLASNASRYITGQILTADGGMTIA